MLEIVRIFTFDVVAPPTSPTINSGLAIVDAAYVVTQNDAAPVWCVDWRASIVIFFT